MTISTDSSSPIIRAREPPQNGARDVLDPQHVAARRAWETLPLLRAEDGLARRRFVVAVLAAMEYHKPRSMLDLKLSRRRFCWHCVWSAAGASVAILGRLRLIAGLERTAELPRGISSWDVGSIEFLRGMAMATVRAARVPPGESKAGGGVNTTGIPLITPGGNYPAFWIRDYAMSLDCGLIAPEEILPQLKLIARCQSGSRERKLKSGAIIPPYSIPDHIRLDGQPVFYPGTYSSGEDQGEGLWGPLPPADDHFYFVHIAYAYWRKKRDPRFLNETIGELSLLQRLTKAFHASETDRQTGAVVAIPPRRSVGFGFEDSIYMLGAMSFATLLRWQAARELADLCRASGRTAEASQFTAISRTITDHLAGTFTEPKAIGGWLRGATQRCRQPDVWATLFALHLGVLPPDAQARARQSVVEAVRTGDRPPVIEYEGAVRHVPVTHDFSDKSAWEGAAGKGTYQNGAYWHTATGWLIEALYQSDPSLAQAVFRRYITHLRRYDFRNRKGGAPWECFGPGLKGAQNPVYMTSVTVPLAVLQGTGEA